MALDLWFRDDVGRMLASHAQAASRLDRGEYTRGYLDALADLAVAFGLAAPVVTRGDWRVRQVGVGDHGGEDGRPRGAAPTGGGDVGQV